MIKRSFLWDSQPSVVVDLTLFRIREVAVLNLSPETGYPDSFLWFRQSLWANAGIAPKMCTTTTAFHILSSSSFAYSPVCHSTLYSQSHWKRGSRVAQSVSVWLRPGRPRFDPRQRQSIFPLTCFQTGTGAHPASCPMGTGEPFPGAWRWPLTPIEYRGREGVGAILPVPSSAFVACIATALAVVHTV
jgi:hypothetical protein